MASYNIYTKSKTIHYPVFFKCERCGNDTTVMHPFVIKAAYSDQGTLFTPGTLRKREGEADEKLAEQESTLYAEILQDTLERNVKNCGYDCVCSHCEAVPVWSRFRNRLLDCVSKLFGYISVIYALFLCFMLVCGNSVPISRLLWLAGMLAIAVGPRFIWYSIKTSKVKALDFEYMPVVCQDMAKLQEILPKLATDRRNTMQEAMSSSFYFAPPKGSDWTCRCGKTHPAYERTCSCGATKAEAKNN